MGVVHLIVLKSMGMHINLHDARDLWQWRRKKSLVTSLSRLMLDQLTAAMSTMMTQKMKNDSFEQIISSSVVFLMKETN
jgi:hypothetical protein